MGSAWVQALLEEKALLVTSVSGDEDQDFSMCQVAIFFGGGSSMLVYLVLQIIAGGGCLH